MAFNIFKWLLKPIGGDKDEPKITKSTFLDEPISDFAYGAESYLQILAYNACIRKIAAAIGAVEWETYRRGKKVEAKEYWIWNYSPNPNQNRTQFFEKLIERLYLDQQALVVEGINGNRYIADSFTIEKHLSGDIYSNISSAGETIPGTFSASEVLYFTLDSCDINVKSYISSISAITGKLLKSAATSYVRNNGKHGKLEIDDVAEASEGFEETYNDLIQNQFKRYFEADNAVLPLFNGYKYTESDTNSSGGSMAAGNTRDIRSMIDDIYELTAIGLGIPTSIATGKNQTDADFETFISSTIMPIARMIAQEINRKVYGAQLVGSGSYVVPNLAAVKYHDIFEIADPIDKLIGSGAFCINDILVLLGRDPIEEPWAEQHWMTKNYSPADDLVSGLDSNIPADEPGKEGK